jgi:hypothetical protein
MPGKLTSIQDRKKLLRANLVCECGKGTQLSKRNIWDETRDKKDVSLLFRINYQWQNTPKNMDLQRIWLPMVNITLEAVWEISVIQTTEWGVQGIESVIPTIQLPLSFLDIPLLLVNSCIFVHFIFWHAAYHMACTDQTQMLDV